MRKSLFLAAAAVTAISAASLVYAGTAEAGAKSCPVDAARASRVIWPTGSIPKGKRVTVRHRCGQRMRCVGGSRSIARWCRWMKH